MNLSTKRRICCLVISGLACCIGCARPPSPEQQPTAEATESGQIETLTLYIPGMNEQLQIL